MFGGGKVGMTGSGWDEFQKWVQSVSIENGATFRCSGKKLSAGIVVFTCIPATRSQTYFILHTYVCSAFCQNNGNLWPFFFAGQVPEENAKGMGRDPK